MKFRKTEPVHYVLAEDEKIKINLDAPAFYYAYFNFADGLLTVRKGYAWDGSTAVRDCDSCMLASLAHDALYQAMHGGVLDWKCRKACDRVYYDLCVAKGMNRLQAWIRYKGIRKLYKTWSENFKSDYSKVYEV